MQSARLRQSSWVSRFVRPQRSEFPSAPSRTLTTRAVTTPFSKASGWNGRPTSRVGRASDPP
eukprot:11973322-Prorocentrum_lima.AAC.1